MATPLPEERPVLTLVQPPTETPVFKDEPAGRPAWIESARTVADRTNQIANLALLPHTFRGYRQLGRRWLDRYHNHYPQLIASADQAVRDAAGDVSQEAQAKRLADGYRADYKQHRKTFLGKTAGVAGAVAGGVLVRDTAWGTREFGFRDPDGNGLTFYRDL